MTQSDFVTTLSLIVGLVISLCALFGYVVKISISFSKIKETQKNSSDDVDLLKSQNDVNTKQISLMQNKISTLEVFSQANTNRIKENETKNAKKFDELFRSQNKSNEILTELNTTIRVLVSTLDSKFDNLDDKFENLNDKIEELRRGKQADTRRQQQ